MKYEDYLKDELIKKCYEKDVTINALKKQLEEIEENETINRDILLENTGLKQELKDTKYQRDMNCNTISNLCEQLEVYKNCINALSGNRD